MFKYIDKLKPNLNILIVGDAMVDLFSFCGPNKRSAEVDIPVTFIQTEEMRLGGAANVWNNVKGLNANAFFCSCVGDDVYGNFIKKCVLNTDLIAKYNATTLKHRYYLNNSQVFRVDGDVICNLSKQKYNNLLKKIKEYHFDGIIISDYLKGFCNEYFIRQIINYANKNNIFVAVDSKFKEISRFADVNLIKINKNEFKELFKEEFNLNIINKIQKTLIDYNINSLLVTLGSEGMVLIEQNKHIKLNAKAVKNADVIGAGDCVISSYTVSYLSNFKQEDCMRFSMLCAAYCVSKTSTTNFSIEEYKKEFYE